MNSHIVNHWKYYKNIFALLTMKKVGVNGDTMTFAEKEEDEFKTFLLTPEADFMWAISEDFKVIVNLYQILIKIITIERKTPTINYIKPDEELKKKD